MISISRAVPLALASALALVGLNAPAQAAQVRPLIQGVVVDQGGRNVDDAQVLALSADGTVVASALTYASDRPDGPQHGYFFLAVQDPGTYTVVIAGKSGYRSADLGEYAVTRRGVVSLGEVVLRKKLVRTSTRLTVADRSLTTAERGGSAVTVSAPDTRRPAGRVVVRVDGRKVASEQLRPRDRGNVAVRLPHLDRGEHSVRATFAPASVYQRGSTSDKVVVKVRRVSGRTVWARAWLPGEALLRLAP